MVMPLVLVTGHHKRLARGRPDNRIFDGEPPQQKLECFGDQRRRRLLAEQQERLDASPYTMPDGRRKHAAGRDDGSDAAEAEFIEPYAVRKRRHAAAKAAADRRAVNKVLRQIAQESRG